MEFEDEFWFGQELLAEKSTDEDGETVIKFKINQELNLGAGQLLATWISNIAKNG